MNLAVDDKCREEFDKLKFRKTDCRYITYKIEKEKIVVDQIGEKGALWEAFITALPESQYRFGVFDFEFKAHDGRQISKLIFINWNPDTSPLKGRVLYATAKESFKKYLDLNTKDFTICAKGDLSQADIQKELEK